jgi:hypothetical protein
MACTLRFEEITPAVWKRLLELAPYLPVSGPSGTLSWSGFTAAYAWDAATGLLTLTLEAMPPWADCERASSVIRGMVSSCMTEA